MAELTDQRIGLIDDEPEVDFDNAAQKHSVLEDNLRDSQQLVQGFKFSTDGALVKDSLEFLADPHVSFPSTEVSQNQIGLVQTSFGNYNKDAKRYDISFKSGIIDPRDSDFTSNVSQFRNWADNGREVTDG